MILFKAIFESIPLFLAVFVILLSVKNYSIPRRKTDRVNIILMSFTSLMLLVAQSSWWATSVIGESHKGQWWANIIWTLFNSFVMICFLLSTRGHHDS